MKTKASIKSNRLLADGTVFELFNYPCPNKSSFWKILSKTTQVYNTVNCLKNGKEFVTRCMFTMLEVRQRLREGRIKIVVFSKPGIKSKIKCDEPKENIACLKARIKDDLNELKCFKL